jgi:hypothetical protein
MGLADYTAKKELADGFAAKMWDEAGSVAERARALSEKEKRFSSSSGAASIVSRMRVKLVKPVLRVPSPVTRTRVGGVLSLAGVSRMAVRICACSVSSTPARSSSARRT